MTRLEPILPNNLDAEQRSLYAGITEGPRAHLVRGMVEGDVDDQAWATWAHVVGDATIFELTTLVGYYATVALEMRVFRVD